MRLAIPASLCEGPFFHILVESVNLFPSISASILSCCVSFIHRMIYSIMFLMFLVLHIALILVSTTLKAIIENHLFVNSSKLSTILRPRAKFAITNYDSLYVSLLCFLYSLQDELYNSELSSIMIYVFDECDASSPYSFIDSSLHKPEVMFIELSFAWGQAKSKLGGS